MTLTMIAQAALIPRAAAQVGTVEIRLTPASVTAEAGGSFSLEVKVAAGERLVDAIDVFLDFDPLYLEVTDASVLGQALPMVLAKEWDNKAGTLDLSAGTLEPTGPKGNFTFGTVTFRAKAGTPAGKPATIRFHKEGSRETEVSSLAQPVLGTAVGAEVTIRGPVATPTPTPKATPTPTATPTATPGATPTPTTPAAPTPLATPTTPAVPTPLLTPSPTPVVTPNPTPLATATPVVTPVPWVSPAPLAGLTPAPPVPTPSQGGGGVGGKVLIFLVVAVASVLGGVLYLIIQRKRLSLG